VSIPIRPRWNPVYTRLADRVITSGEAIRAQIVAAGTPAARVVPIAAGVDLGEFGPRPREERLALELGLEGAIVGSVAMFRGSKGHGELLDAFRLLLEGHPGARLLLVGDGIRRREIEALATERGIRHLVVFTGMRQDVPALLSIMDCFVLASTRSEGVPQSLLQALAAEIPVVATAVGGIPEVVEDGKTGILVPPGDPRALAEGIRAVLRDPETARRRASMGHRLVAARFSREAALDRLLGLYEDVLRTAPSRGREAA
jgi:glycosyltransferase involved in cell wall biosynthesis